ncbi:50S ribosomal protein L5 [Planctomycetales bacterium]|jgi:large subunit ribosomal protein L5|nr:50S ribosomal protein L5 [Planctomycetota bacterium]GHS92203.1 50S ribosomal protein L5 [Planctomycetales bacterium]GHS99758.1 50S ribosomal protein L5 [Planctomycetales bacterium]GHT07246.1 50S ribosomal protein L5 [Planctomycetales bacterium]GHV18527.1 50S ribosomal protein L5 [Planctomycetales bacterium]
MSLSQEKYQKEVVPALREEFGIKNINAVPRLVKVCLNMGVGKAIDEAKVLDVAKKDLTLIAGQAAAVTTAKVAISNFHLREGQRIGCRVTLRRQRMYEFIDRLINVAIPRIRDFRGVKDRAFDKQGNYSLGIEDINIFPEINTDAAEYNLGMDVTFVIKNSAGAEQSKRFLKLLGMPFVERDKKE